VIYVIDNDPSVRKALQRLIKSDNLPVRAYASGHDFLTAAGPTESDCVVVDTDIPGLTGLELLQHLRGTGLKTPVILLTPHDDKEIRAKARRLGAAGCFLKPVDGQALLDAIRFQRDNYSATAH